jgi:hypothetical protein
MKFTLNVTVNWKDGTDKTIYCHPQSLYNLKKVVGEFITDTLDATSFMFVVVKQPEMSDFSCDSHGRPYLRVEDAKEGVIVECSGLTCMTEMEEATLLRDSNGALFFSCADGRHYIKGQLDHAGTCYLGLYNVEVQDRKGKEEKSEATGT